MWLHIWTSNQNIESVQVEPCGTAAFKWNRGIELQPPALMLWLKSCPILQVLAKSKKFKMAAAPVYPHDIDSLHEIDNAIFPQIYSNLDLNRHIAAGTLINNANLRHARGIAKALEGHNGEFC